MKRTTISWRAAISKIRSGTSSPIRNNLAQFRLSYQISPSTGRHVFTSNDRSSTIYALSTAPGRAAIAVIRISGTKCLEVYNSLCPGSIPLKPRYATVRTIYEPEHSGTNVLDSGALVLYFPGPRTATGEDVLELHVHGGPAVVKAVLEAIPKCVPSKAIRYAEPGEFTRRAFWNNRLDLTQVEALGDVLAATTEQQRRLSVQGTNGALPRRYESWRRQLLYARGELEALIDFSEDQHFDESPVELCSSVATQVQALCRNLTIHSQNAIRGELLRHGIGISLLGAPNAGKSSLLNCIVGREAAIVSQEAGTTRDIVEVGLDVGGYFCRMGDTAGLRRAKEETMAGRYKNAVISQIEQEGMRRAKERAAESDAVIVVLFLEKRNGQVELCLDEEVISTALQLLSTKNNLVVVINKSDLLDNQAEKRGFVDEVLESLPTLSRDRIHFTSCLSVDSSNPSQASSSMTQTKPSGAGNENTKETIQCFLQGLISVFESLTRAEIPVSDNITHDGGAEVESDESIWQESLGATQRHRLLLDECIEYLNAFLRTVDPHVSVNQSDEIVHNGEGGVADTDIDIVLAAEHLRSAGSCLARITGRSEEAGDVEEVLGVVFEKFCVGK